MDQLARRQVRVTKQHNEEVRQLLKLMGIPCVVAPSEAEAQCAELVRAGKVYGAGSEDMDTLTFGTPILLKHLTFSEQKKMPVHEVTLDKALSGLEMSRDQFIDLCILLGCDYLEQIKGIGPKTALKLIREHGTLTKIIEHLKEEKSTKVTIPEFWPFEEAKKLFINPDVLKADDMELKWEAPDVEGLVDFLCKDKGFSEERVRSGAARLQRAIGQKQQGRLDGFFTVQTKRKPEEEAKKGSSSKKSKGKKK